MTIKEVMTFVVDEIEAAESKHPVFPECPTAVGISTVRQRLRQQRSVNDHDPKKATQNGIIEEEVLEALEASLEERHFDAAQEWFQVAAVAVRAAMSEIAKAERERDA